MSYAGLGDYSDQVIQNIAAQVVEGAYPILEHKLELEVPVLIEQATPALRAALASTLADADVQAALQGAMGATKQQAVAALLLATVAGSLLTYYLVKNL